VNQVLLCALQIILDLPFGFPINNIISLSLRKKIPHPQSKDFISKNPDLTYFFLEKRP